MVSDHVLLARLIHLLTTSYKDTVANGVGSFSVFAVTPMMIRMAKMLRYGRENALARGALWMPYHARAKLAVYRVLLVAGARLAIDLSK